MDQKNERVIYFAAGCFWGTEHLMRSIKGVVDAESGYANGVGAESAQYQTIKAGGTGFRETVRVVYDPTQVTLDALLFAYFYIVDPTVQNRQGEDVGTQYQTGIYYTDEETRKAVERVAALEKGRCEKFFVELKPLENFFPAEEYHQNYLTKHPDGYCHIPWDQMDLFASLRIDPGRYPRPSQEAIREKLTETQYRVTQESATETPFTGDTWDNMAEGLYVDVVTGEPLFSSRDKFPCECGWAAFTRPIELPALIEVEDRSHGMVRTEVRSRAGDSHLGHVFRDEPGVPGGVRYCINSAALRFIPLDAMEKEGYGYLTDSVK